MILSYQPLLPHKSPAVPRRSELKLYPFSLILISSWAVFTVVLLWWMETVVRRGHGKAEKVTPSPSSQPWTFATLPGILLTVFAQAHVPITGIHLARTAVSALQHHSSAPNSWMELFWIADQEWMGPIGIIKTTRRSIRYRTRTSLTFILFAATSAIALITPVLMTQAFKVDNVLLTHLHEGFMVPDTISFKRMVQIEASAQLNVGLHSLEFDSYVPTTIERSEFYLPRSIQKDTIPSELVIAGTVGNASVLNLPALHLNVSCSPADSSGLDTRDLNTSWPSFCQSHISSFNGLGPDPGRTGGTQGLSEFSLHFCNNHTSAFPFTDEGGTQSRNTGYVYYTYTPLQFNNTQNRSGLIQCNSTLTPGVALVHGLNRTYSGFSPATKLPATDRANPKKPLLDPLSAAFTTLGRPELDLEYTLFRNVNSGVLYPNVEAVSAPISDWLQNAVIAFTNALARLSRDPDTPYPAQVPMPVAFYTRNNRYAICAYVAIASWALLVAALTARSYRRTFSSSLNSYVAAELAFRERHLLEGVPIGEADDNEMLKGARFVFPSEGTGVSETSKETKFISQDI
ncbi:hypothetical protein V5O48_012734 [Marasmius crinis-equi]|uniref:Transmembrane protein n=1 Tax=Marasmius crinis-equi TaxID=585013 RepID=A0ABR3F204_9AGAR